MQLSVVEEKPDHLFVRVEGPYDIREVQPIFESVAKELLRVGKTRLLMDVVGITGPIPTFLERYQIGMKSLVLPPGVRFAMLAREEQLDPGRFGQTVARNRGLAYAVFTDETDARAWLLSNDDAAPAP